ncbi:MAG: multinuclear nonheme iron-dependent oxidase, partial [Terriglobales bacterium]
TAEPGEPGPLLLLELPPLTYFGTGDLPVAEFFRRLAERAACGLVLDVGHLWTVYRYTGEWRRRSVEAFVAEFLDAFPLERVVQIHLAGLACHPDDVPARLPDARPYPRWIDAHAAPIPAVLCEMLAQVLLHPDLRSLKGVALEVDTKPVSLILSEFEQMRARFGALVERLSQRVDSASLALPDAPPEPRSFEDQPSMEARGLREQYELYARTVTGRSSADLPALFRGFGTESEALNAYRQAYLPHEILVWGGDLRDMFPETCRALDARHIPLAGFVHYWFREARAVLGPYDFFLLKSERFCAYVEEVLPSAACTAAREAAELRAAYEAVNRDVSCVMGGA